MLDKLPTEIVRECLNYLDTKESIQYLLVNKAWKKHISSTNNIYHTVKVKSKTEFEDVCKYFKKHKDYAKQTRHLSICGGEMTLKKYISLPSIFPSVEVFHVEEDIFHAIKSSNWDTKEATQEFKKWKDTIQSIKEFGAPICTHGLLTRGKCESLKYLYLDLSGMAKDIDRTKYITKLKHAPNLVSLYIETSRFTIKEFEKLISNAPNLKKLVCVNIEFWDAMFDMDKIEPPAQLETMYIGGGSYATTRAVARWLFYFSKKLIHVKNFIHDPMEIDLRQQNMIFNYFEKELAEMLSNMTQLEFLRMHAFEMRADVFRAMAKGGVQLKKLDLGPTAVGNMYKALFKTKQKDYIESLTSTGDPLSSLEEYDFKYPKDTQPNFLRKLSQIPNLKHLRILQWQADISLPNVVYLDRIIEFLPNLESLEMDFGKMIVEYDSDKPMETKLKKLRLIEFQIDAVNKFKDEKDEKEREAMSEDYLQDILPNTEVVLEELVEGIDREWCNGVLFN